MTTDPLQRQEALRDYQPSDNPSPYQLLYGLRDNPFPSLALFSPTADDPRRNGRIYDSTFRTREEQRFFRLFIQPQSGEDAIRLGFLRLDTQAGGRGTGKSCFLNRVMGRVNAQDWQDWSSNPQDPRLNSLAIHLLPEPRKQRHLWQLARLVFETMAESDLFSRVDLDLRAAMFFKLVPQDRRTALLTEQRQKINEALRSSTGFLKLMNEVAVTPQDFVNAVDAGLRQIGENAPDHGFRDVFVKAGCDLGTAWKTWTEDYSVSNDYAWRKAGVAWLVNGLVPVLVMAGYQRLVLLVDEFERIYRSQTGREREEFLYALRQTFYEGGSVAARREYVTTVLTIHPSMEGYLSKVWSRVGLDHLAPLDPDRIDHVAVELGRSTSAALLHLLATYLDYFRSETDEHRGTVYPFADDALEPVFTDARYYPRGALWYAHHILRKAVTERTPPLITKAFVEQFLGTGEKPPLDELDQGYQLPESETDLQK